MSNHAEVLRPPMVLACNEPMAWHVYCLSCASVLTGWCDKQSGQRQEKPGWDATPELESSQSAGCDDHCESHSDVDTRLLCFVGCKLPLLQPEFFFLVWPAVSHG